MWFTKIANLWNTTIWILSISFLICLTCNALPSNRRIHKFDQQAVNFLFDENSINHKMVVDMNDAFKIFPNGAFIKNMIPKMFNINNPNPAYIFVLPDKNNNIINRRLVIRRSDLTKPKFPNITATDIILNWMLKSDKKIQEIHRPLFYSKRPEIDVLNPESGWKSNRIPMERVKDDDDNAVLSNVRTEKNFVEYVKNLNAYEMTVAPTMNPLEFIRNENDTNKDFIEEHFGTDEWDDLGLSGWKGTLVAPKHDQDEQSFLSATESTKYLKKNEKELLQIKSIDPEKIFTPVHLATFEKPSRNNSWDLPGRVTTVNGQTLAITLNDTLIRVFKYSPRIEWPITSNRENHRDSDIFIARANDPFGHSLKWRMRNETRHYDERQKRAVVELYSMIKCSTGCDPIVFKGYGCFCGFSGAGRPMDGIDRCCKSHDSCYERSGCPAYLEYFVPYVWKCYRGKPLCAVEHGEWGGTSSCASRLCQCDLNLSKCLQKFQCPRKRSVCRSSKIRMLQNLLLIL